MPCDCPPGSGWTIFTNDDRSQQWRRCSRCGAVLGHARVREKAFFTFPLNAQVYPGARFRYEGSGYVVTGFWTHSDSRRERVVVAKRCPVITVDADSRLGEMASLSRTREVHDRCVSMGYTGREQVWRRVTAEEPQEELRGRNQEWVSLSDGFPDRMRADETRRFMESMYAIPGEPLPEDPAPERLRKEPTNEAFRALTAEERLFMFRSVARIEAELRWVLDNNATVRRVWNEAKAAKLSDTSAAEMALICLARELEELRAPGSPLNRPRPALPAPADSRTPTGSA